MQEFAAIVLAFGAIPLITRKKVPIGFALLAAGALMNLIGGLGPRALLDNFVTVFLKPSNQRTLLTILEIGILANLLKAYGMLDQIVEDFERLIKRTKVIIMILPAFMGLLPVSGGALLSAPFVDTLGDKINLPPDKKTATNLTFRHTTMLTMPHTNHMLMVASMVPGINIYTLLLMNLPIGIVLAVAGYFLYLRGEEKGPAAQPVPGPAEAAGLSPQGEKSRGRALRDLLINMSPVLCALFLNLVFGLPFYLSVLVSLFLTWVICDKKDFFRHLVKGINPGTLLMVAGVYFIQNSIASMDRVMETFSRLFLSSGGSGVLLVIGLISFVFGIMTGLSITSLGIVLPLLISFAQALPLAPSIFLCYVYFASLLAFLGYYFSPLHLCQMLTIQYLRCSTGAMYRQNLKLLPILLGWGVALFYFYQWIFV